MCPYWEEIFSIDTCTIFTWLILSRNALGSSRLCSGKKHSSGGNNFSLFPDSLPNLGICSGEKDNCLVSVNLFRVSQLFKCKTLYHFPSHLYLLITAFQLGSSWYIPKFSFIWSNDTDFLMFLSWVFTVAMEKRGGKTAGVYVHVGGHEND